MLKSDSLKTTLKMLAKATAMSQDQWWIIGSAAVALHGHEVADIRDVDVLMSERDAKSFLQSVDTRWGEGEPSDRFHSLVFGVWGDPPLPVEAFGGFQLGSGGKWRTLGFSSREAIDVGGATLYVPSRSDLLDLLYSFGRPKDLKRANLLQE